MVSRADFYYDFSELEPVQGLELTTQYRQDLKFLMQVLNERDRRLVAGFLAKYQAKEGDKVLAELTGLHIKTVRQGCEDIAQKKTSGRIRRRGGGRRPKALSKTFLTELQRLLHDETAGDPMTGKKWVRQTLRWIKKRLAAKHIQVSLGTIRKALKKLGYSLKKNVKNLARSQHSQREAQFQYLTQLKHQFLAANKPVISIDTKKKEQIGLFSNPGRTWRQQAHQTLDHDFRSDAQGLLIPFGLYDIGRNKGHMYGGTSYETSEFVVDAIALWWETIGRQHYPDTTDLLILADAGGANGYRRRLWKWELQKQLADRLGLTITVCHFPSGASKWNPIEHRLFSYISLNWAGQPLSSYDLALSYIRSTTTEQGLQVDAILLDKTYQRGIKISDNQMHTLCLTKHEICPQWNYTIRPRTTEATP